MTKYRAVVYRAYSKEIIFEDTDAPEMIGPEDKAEKISRGIEIGEWTLNDVSVDVYGTEE